MPYSLNTPWQASLNVTSTYLDFMCSAAIAQEDDAESTTANTSDEADDAESTTANSSDDGDTTSTLSSTTDSDAGKD